MYTKSIKNGGIKSIALFVSMFFFCGVINSQELILKDSKKKVNHFSFVYNGEYVGNNKILVMSFAHNRVDQGLNSPSFNVDQSFVVENDITFRNNSPNYVDYYPNRIIKSRYKDAYYLFYPGMRTVFNSFKIIELNHNLEFQAEHIYEPTILPYNKALFDMVEVGLDSFIVAGEHDRGYNGGVETLTYAALVYGDSIIAEDTLAYPYVRGAHLECQRVFFNEEDRKVHFSAFGTYNSYSYLDSLNLVFDTNYIKSNGYVDSPSSGETSTHFYVNTLSKKSFSHVEGDEFISPAFKERVVVNLTPPYYYDTISAGVYYTTSSFDSLKFVELTHRTKDKQVVFPELDYDKEQGVTCFSASTLNDLNGDDYFNRVPSNRKNRGYLAQLNKAGEIIWDIQLKSDSFHYMPQSAIVLPDSTCAFVGSRYTDGEMGAFHVETEDAQLFYIKIDSAGFVTSVSDPKIKEDLSSLLICIYPNPAQDYIQFELPFQNAEQSYTYQILSSDGKVVSSGEELDKRIDIKDLTKGNYILRVNQHNGEKFTSRFVVE